MRRWTVVAAVAAVSGMAWIGLRGSRAESPEPSRTHREPESPAAAEPPRPRPRPPAAPRPARAEAPEEEEDRAPPTAESAAADEGEPGPTDQEVVQTLDSALRSEPVDAEWGRAMEARIQGYLQSERGAGSSLLRSECRSTLCRIEVRHASSESAEHFTDHVSSFIPPKSQAAIHRNRDAATPETVVYFTREGSLPLP